MEELRRDINTPKAYNFLRWFIFISEAVLLFFYCVAISKSCFLLSAVILVLAFAPIIVYMVTDKLCFKQMNNEIQEARMRSLQLTIADYFSIDGLDQVLAREKVEMAYKRSLSYRLQYVVGTIFSKVVLILLMTANALIVIDEFSNVYYYIGTVVLFAVFLSFDYKKLLVDDWCLRLLSNDYREWIITKRILK